MLGWLVIGEKFPRQIHFAKMKFIDTLALTMAWLVAMPSGYSAEPLQVAPPGPAGKSAAPEKSLPSSPEVKSYLLLHQGMNQGYSSEEVDPEDIDAYFWHVFSRLPDEVMVYPSENYYYFVDCIRGMQIWGNIRLPAGRRERSILSFAYAEFVEFPTGTEPYLSRAKYFTEADALTIQEIDKFTFLVKFNRRSVLFRLYKLSQEPPKLFSLRPDEVFVERTFDESGIQFFLLFNTNRNYFSWVLNEEEKVPDIFDAIEKDILLGRRTGFAFWIDSDKGGRKVLALVRRLSVARNDYYDGPSDQLADNYVDRSRISEWMERANPSLKGRIDKYGYYTDTERPARVALACYGMYDSLADITDFVKHSKAAADPNEFMSRSGVASSSLLPPPADSPKPIAIPPKAAPVAEEK